MLRDWVHHGPYIRRGDAGEPDQAAAGSRRVNRWTIFLRRGSKRVGLLQQDGTRRERSGGSSERRRVGVHAVLERVKDCIRHDRGRVPVPVLVGHAEHLLRPRTALRPLLLGARAPRAPDAGEDDAQVQARQLRHERTGGREKGCECTHGRRGRRGEREEAEHAQRRRRRSARFCQQRLLRT